MHLFLPLTVGPQLLNCFYLILAFHFIALKFEFVSEHLRIFLLLRRRLLIFFSAIQIMSLLI